MARNALFLSVIASCVVLALSASVDNFVTSWTTASLAAVRAGGGYSVRTYAITQLSIYRTLTTTRLSKYPGANLAAAASYAAHFTLSSLYPGQQNANFDKLLATELLKLNLSSRARSKSKELGKYHALLLLSSRLNDGTFDYKAFTPADPATALPDQYQFTPGQTYAQYPNGPNFVPFVPSVKIKNFDLGAPYRTSSSEFAAQLAEVKAFGFVNSTARTEYQTQTALFYALGAGTFEISGQWFPIALQVISNLKPNATPLETSKIFTLIALAQHQVRILGWTLKYKYKYVRPVTAIRRSGDATWSPLLNTPPHPEYPSGHSVVGAASAAVLAKALGVTVYTVIPPFNATSEGFGFPPRTFTKLHGPVVENGMSRVYAGVHYRQAATDSILMGYNLGKDIHKKFV